MPHAPALADQGCTIVSSPWGRHKWRWAASAVLWSVVATAATAQQVETSEGLTLGRVASVLSAGAVYLLPRVVDLNEGPPACAPCDRATVPAFDRWIIRPEVPAASYASTYLLAGLGAVTMLEQFRGADGTPRVLAAVEAASWAVGITELAKALFDRNRPVLYTDDALAEAPYLASQRSMPSGHTAAAFALAASYWLNAPERGPWVRGAALVGALSVGVLRVVSARHFPSDVVVGAGVGIAAAVVVHEIRF